MCLFRSLRIPFRLAPNRVAPKRSSGSSWLERQFSVSHSANSFCKNIRGTDDKLKLFLSPAPEKIFLQKARTICGRENCKDPCDFPPCPPGKSKNKEPEEKKFGENFYEIYWNRPECCDIVCVDAMPRFDDLYYRESDKENRVYTQTWVDCPPMVIAPRPICCTIKTEYPPLCKRPRKEKPQTACAQEEKCPPDLEGKCPRITMPCCRPARIGRCVKGQVENKCKKFKAPQPSFSECEKPKRKAKITECTCLTALAECEVSGRRK